MQIQADSGQRGNAPAAHATGFLTPTAYGILEGSVDFPIRGPIRLRMERRDSDEKGQRARLYSLTPGISFGYLHSRAPDIWTGSVKVEGYLFDVRVEKEGRQFAVAFSDTALVPASDSGVRGRK